MTLTLHSIRAISALNSNLFALNRPFLPFYTLVKTLPLEFTLWAASAQMHLCNIWDIIIMRTALNLSNLFELILPYPTMLELIYHCGTNSG